MSSHESHKNLRLDNSFTLLIDNLSAVETDISLFLLGVNGNTIPVDTKLSENEFDGSDGIQHFRPTSHQQIETFADVVTNPLVVTGLDIRFTNSSNISGITIAPNTNLDDLNTIINTLQPYPTGTTGADIKFIIGFKQGGTTKDMTFNITNSGNSENILKVDFISGATTTPVNTQPYLDRAVSTNGFTSMVSVRDSAGLTYDEILRSQNGSVLDVRSMGYNLLRANSPTDQMNQCMRFDKTDVNGNSVTYYKCPVKDPYQFQNSFGIIDMGKKADIYTLDGETQFNYLLKSLTSCQITFNYAELTNLMLVPSEIAEAQYQSEKLKELNEREDYKRLVEVVTPAQETEGAFSSADGEVEENRSEILQEKPKDRKIVQGLLKMALLNPMTYLVVGGIVYFAYGKKLGIRK